VSAATRILRIGLLLLALVLAGAAYFYFRLEYPGKPETLSQATIVFAPGTATAEIFRRLEQAGIVRDARVAEIYYRIYRGRTPLQAGE